MDAPTLRTARLSLAAHTVADFEDSAALWADPEVVRHIGGKASTREESWARLLRYAGLWRLLGFGYWVVRDGSSGRFVGEVGFADFARSVDPPIAGIPEVGWALSPWAHGQGFAAEALAAALAWIDARADHERTVCIISPANAPSLVLARKLGFQPFADTTYRGSEVSLFERASVGRLRSR